MKLQARPKDIKPEMTSKLMFRPKLLRARVDHMTPLLASFHWLPCKLGIVLKSSSSDQQGHQR